MGNHWWSFPSKPEGDLILGPPAPLQHWPPGCGAESGLLYLEMRTTVPIPRGGCGKLLGFDVAGASGSEQGALGPLQNSEDLSPLPDSTGEWEVGGLGLKQSNLPSVLPPGGLLSSSPGSA